MIEHIARRGGVGAAETGRGVYVAAREFLAPLFGSSLATLIIFVPLAFLSGVTGAFFKFLSVTMAAAILISFVLTALIVPLLARMWIDFDKWVDHDSGSGRLARAHGRLLDRLFARPLWAAAAVGLLIGAGWLAYTHVGTGFLPRMDEGGFVIDYTAKPGTSLAETNRELEQVEAILRKDPDVYTYSRRTGAGLGGDLNETYQGDFFVRLIPASQRPPIWTVMDRVARTITADVPGIAFDPHQLLGDMIGDMVGRRQPVVIDLGGRDPNALLAAAPQVAAAIAKVPGIEPASIDDGVVPAGDALDIRVRPAAALLGITPADVRRQVHAALHGIVATRFAGTVRDIGVRLRLAAGSRRPTRRDLDHLPIRAPSGHLYPLDSVADISFVAGQPQITRDNLAQVVAVTAEIGGGHDLGSTVAAVKRVLDRPGLLPPGVTYRIGGAYKQQKLAAEGMTKVFAAAAIAEFILLLFLYDRMVLALLVIASAILSSGAVFIGLWLSGVEFNITAMMGMVMIVGIATEMAIFFASEARALEGVLPRREALRRAAVTRLRPIVMSSLAMILALLPLGAALSGSGDQMLQPLAIAIIAGIVIQLPLVLLVLPVAVAHLTPARGQ
jgi:multidrug efflux pump subunit AcrB